MAASPVRWVRAAVAMTLSALAASFLALFALAVEGVATDGPRHFLTRDGDQIMDGDRPLRFVSFNVPNLLVIEDEFRFTRRAPFRWPDAFEIEDALESIRQMGGQVVRTYVISVYREGSDMGETVHVLGPGQFNEEAFGALDRVLEAANRKGIRILIPLVDQWHWMGGIAQYAAFRDKPAEAFWTDRQLIGDFKKTIRHVVTRKNTITGVRYRDDPAIFGWQTGNEIEAPDEWNREIAAYLKALDPNHLVIDGRTRKGVPPASLEDPSIDVVSTHHYPHGTSDFVPAIRAARAQAKGKKPYFVGEFGFVPTAQLAAVLDAVIEEGVAGALLWSLRFHRREGGFYWHMEVGSGGNFYKSYHWPGFASGDAYDERQVMQLMREAAFRIRGAKPPPIEPPEAPTLLSIKRPSAISWQGATGASSYDVERAEAVGGPWTTVGRDVSDADVQYRPLFNDETVTPGEAYYYRIVARNEGGDSAPSNVVGPVEAVCRTLIDEGMDLARVETTEGEVWIATENARAVEEDAHRIAMVGGSAVVYRTEGPVSGVRVLAFARDRSAALALSTSRDGKRFAPLAAHRQEFADDGGEYGYLRRVLYQADAAGQQATYVRIALDEANGTGATEDELPPVEISRVEIEYDAVDARRPPAGEAAPLTTTIFVGGRMGFMGDPVAAVDKAAQLGNRRLNVCVKILVDLDERLRVKSFGMVGGGPRAGTYRPFDDAMRESLKETLRRTFSRMVEHGMDIFILPHIDADGEVREWRNWIDFDPLAAYNGYTYEHLMIDTLAEALEQAATDQTRIELALSGEMGTSLFGYPQSYLTIVERLRSRRNVPNLKVGISLNHNQVAGEGSPALADDEPVMLSDEQRAGVQKLIDVSDFVGMSFYRPVRVEVTPQDFVRGIEFFMGELQKHGLTVPKSTPMHFSEVGIGGGHGGDGLTTDDPAEAVQTPWQGTGNARHNPWSRSAAMRDLRRRYHAALLAFLRDQPAPWKVSAAFFWSMGSWDPQAMQHAAFADAEIMEAIERHNAATGGQ